MKNCRNSAGQAPGKDKPQNDLPDKPPPGPAGVDASPVAPGEQREEFHSDLPDKPPPGPAGFDR
ncbi:hypothetical protein HRD49_01005 [Corallococcus exiguus]|uniref:Uncharacterized protein n=1 Tax=Corallococcus exiguus TaxID=83462 RepID=A0A7X4YI23_9BACT|nr:MULTISPECIES: hypothetical protein [Corallococcus]RKI32686.1 hypothetical protein D7Y27_35760 [Corallococcus sp. AB004]NBC45801.1 hypothetical protein [Corallococcus exiguus]NNC20136.1 hypothetical protein [Corallococcus exiguus]NPC75189.1 hypothetical protein [Corallococcus exiguus]NPD29107.1 hypothetical protein [Corallococcus exiguus]